MGDISFTILGSSAGMPQAERANSGYVLDIGGRLIQFDCGGGISARFRRAEFDPLAVERIVISHTHADHMSDLPLYIQMIHLAGRENQKNSSIEIHVPGEAMDAMRAYLRAAYLHPEKLRVQYELLPVPDDGPIEMAEVSILPIRNGHLKGHADIISEHNWKNKMQCYSYLIKVDGKSILYSADLGTETDIFPYMKNLDLLVVESTHINIGSMLQKAAENNIGRIILTHIEVDFDIGQALNTAQKLGVDNLSIAHDGLRIEL